MNTALRMLTRTFATLYVPGVTAASTPPASVFGLGIYTARRTLCLNSKKEGNGTW